MTDSFRCIEPLPEYPHLLYASLPRAEAHGAGPLSRLPYSLRMLAEHLLRHEDGTQIVAEDIVALSAGPGTDRVVAFHPGRVMFQDSSGLPVLADLIALREAVQREHGDVGAVTPRLPMDLIVDHAVEADHWGSREAAVRNVEREYERHHDRYKFLGWAARRLPGLTVVPPGVGICHQLNLEVLAHVVATSVGPDGREIAGFDSLLGTDSHTPMVNALAVLGWGVGGIEATAAVLGEPTWMRIPEVVGVRLVGELPDGALASDLALNLTAVLREYNLVGRFVEFCGPGVATLAVPDRATVANMAPEYGATVSLFPVDDRTIEYLRGTGRSAEHVALVEAYLRAQGMLWSAEAAEPEFAEVIEFDLGAVAPTVAGPHRPSQRLGLADLPATVPARTRSSGLSHGDVVLAAITSCTNTSNPRALIAAGLLAQAARDRGLRVDPRIKTTFAPGSRMAARMLELTGLQDALDAQGFHVAGFGCMTCMGNSGPLDPAIEREISGQDLAVAAVLSGNRNFPGRVHPLCRLAYLASPPLVVAFALAGRMDIDLSVEPLGIGADGRPVHLADVWPSPDALDHAIGTLDFRRLARDELDSRPGGASIDVRRWEQSFHADRDSGDGRDGDGPDSYDWDGPAGFIRRPPFLDGELARPQITGDLLGARPLLVLGDSITTDHISPVSRIAPDSPAGRWLSERGVAARDHASFSARRLNHDVMLRGGFANIRLQNLLVPDRLGGFTRVLPDGDVMAVHEAARVYRERGVPVVVVAGDHYGAGSARDWAAKVTRLLGVRAVIARGFERIHRTNLLAMGVLPLRLPDGVEFALDGSETLDLLGLRDALVPGGRCLLRAHSNGRGGGSQHRDLELTSVVMTPAEAAWLREGGLLPKILAASTRQDS